MRACYTPWVWCCTVCCAHHVLSLWRCAGGSLADSVVVHLLDGRYFIGTLRTFDHFSACQLLMFLRRVGGHCFPPRTAWP